MIMKNAPTPHIPEKYFIGAAMLLAAGAFTPTTVELVAGRETRIPLCLDIADRAFPAVVVATVDGIPAAELLRQLEISS